MKHKANQIKYNSWATTGNHLADLISQQIRVKISRDISFYLSQPIIFGSMIVEIRCRLKT